MFDEALYQGTSIYYMETVSSKPKTGIKPV